MEPDEDEAMAAQMGFSSFSQKPQAKKRKIEDGTVTTSAAAVTTTRQTASQASQAQPFDERSDPTQQDDLRALRRGVRNERGDMVYFMPSFIEDPWAKLRSSSS